MVIKGHRVISTPDTSIVCPLWTPTEEKRVTWNNTTLEALIQRAPRNLQPLINPLLAYYSGMEDSSSADTWKAEVTDKIYMLENTYQGSPCVDTLRNHLQILLFQEQRDQCLGDKNYQNLCMDFPSPGPLGGNKSRRLNDS